MEREDVDYTPLAVEREGDLGSVNPTGKVDEITREGLVQRRLPGVRQPLELAVLEPNAVGDPSIERRAQTSKSSSRDIVKVTALDGRYGRRRYGCATGDIDLAPTAPDAQSAQLCTDA